MKFPVIATILLVGIVCVDHVELQKERTLLDALNHFVRESVNTFFFQTGNALKKRGRDTFWTPFPCKGPYRSEEKPTSVHKLRPGDIDVVAAMGDSMTVAHGAAAKGLFDMAVENRGISWSGGGQGTWKEFLTLPNILKEFNPNLVGYSTGDAAAIFRESQFNVAEGGAMSRDTPYMAKVLVKRIMADERVNFTHDWKMVTLMIGLNDQCSDICVYANRSSVLEAHRRHLTKTLEYLRDNMPRTIVNIVPPPNVELGLGHYRKSIICDIVHMIGCSCMLGPNVKLQQRAKIVEIMRKWHVVEEEVCQDNRFKTKDDFAVVLQPFTSNVEFPKKNTPKGRVDDNAILSQDCAHLSVKGNALAAFGLWTNIMEPVGSKSLNWKESPEFPCPTENAPYIYTWKNSGHSANITQVLPL